ncbi:MAG TPA: SOS response-associated peptidase [Pyrinomonadaceae bacterium]|jgi:putative SOS response-associated peptidase YedK|nr:SOS response-associated peptidase [Pyrinomonadaceae bacterium]
MCGRFALHSRDRIKLKGLTALDLPFEARYNIAPSQQILVIAYFGKGIEVRMLTWGLIPSWSTDGKGFINARAETLEEKPSFSEAFRLRRCLIPADGFYEWEHAGREKRPYYIQSIDEGPIMFAGIWDTWRNRGETITWCAIITTAANELVGELHDRMPAILPPEIQEAWLDRRTNRAELLRTLAPYPASRMKTYPVSSRVNSPNNHGSDLIMRVDAEIGVTQSLF